ncbi:hypothetical protein [uncultured Nostoc sp.]|uniref:hypothetical protein n=1 Tax=uncultured Nostoc sp. TaxID=340711 RepID=UPI0035CA801E
MITLSYVLMELAVAIQRELGNLFRALGNPDGVYATVRTPEALTPTTFEQFAKYKLLPNIC